MNPTNNHSGRPARSTTKAAKNALRNRRDKLDLRRHLKGLQCCDVCSVKFTNAQRSLGISVCYKVKCSYLNALRQSDAWSATARRLRAQMEYEQGAVDPQDHADSPASCTAEEAFAQSPVVVSGRSPRPSVPVVMESTQCCPHPGCVRSLDTAIIQSMEAGTPADCVLHMALDGLSVGRCNQCRDAHMPLYYFCHKHYNKHRNHASPVSPLENAIYYESNDPVVNASPAPVPSLPVPIGPTDNPLYSDEVPDGLFQYDALFESHDLAPFDPSEDPVVFPALPDIFLDDSVFD
jgi:hypothetical protein